MTDPSGTRPPDFRRYSRIAIAEMADWFPGFDMSGISVSEVDASNGSPRVGDKIARNPANHEDRWLVAAAYFVDNFRPLQEGTRPPAESEAERRADAPEGNALTLEKLREGLPEPLPEIGLLLALLDQRDAALTREVERRQEAEAEGARLRAVVECAKALRQIWRLPPNYRDKSNMIFNAENDLGKALADLPMPPPSSSNNWRERAERAEAEVARLREEMKGMLKVIPKERVPFVVDEDSFRAAPSRAPEPIKSCFDVGNGKFEEGDEVVVNGHLELGVGRIATIFHDGDAEVEFKKIRTVKWRQISALPRVPEATMPCAVRGRLCNHWEITHSCRRSDCPRWEEAHMKVFGRAPEAK